MAGALRGHREVGVSLENAQIFAGPARPLEGVALADDAAVRGLVHTYALGVDSRDFELVRSVFTEDGFGDGALGASPFSDYLPKVFKGAAVYSATQHNVTTQNVRLNGDEAVVWSHAVAYHIEEPGNGRDDLIVGVQYRDLCKRTPQGWLIARRKVVMQWVKGPIPRK